MLLADIDSGTRSLSVGVAPIEKDLAGLLLHGVTVERRRVSRPGGEASSPSKSNGRNRIRW